VKERFFFTPVRWRRAGKGGVGFRIFTELDRLNEVTTFLFLSGRRQPPFLSPCPTDKSFLTSDGPPLHESGCRPFSFGWYEERHFPSVSRTPDPPSAHYTPRVGARKMVSLFSSLWWRESYAFFLCSSGVFFCKMEEPSPWRRG